MLVMAYRLLREFRQASTHLDTPPFSLSYHPFSSIAPLTDVAVETLEVRPSRSRPEMGAVKRRVVCLNQHDEPVMTMEGTGLFATRPGA